MLIKNNESRMINLGGKLRLYPGYNYVAASNWEWATKIKLVRKYVELDVLQPIDTDFEQLPASQIFEVVENTFSRALIWTLTTGEFGPGFGDYEDHQEVATRLAFHFNRSDENKESQPNAESP